LRGKGRGKGEGVLGRDVSRRKLSIRVSAPRAERKGGKKDYTEDHSETPVTNSCSDPHHRVDPPRRTLADGRRKKKKGEKKSSITANSSALRRKNYASSVGTEVGRKKKKKERSQAPRIGKYLISRDITLRRPQNAPRDHEGRGRGEGRISKWISLISPQFQQAVTSRFHRDKREREKKRKRLPRFHAPVVLLGGTFAHRSPHRCRS